MRALVTGAAGFIGSHLVGALLAEGHEVVGADCFTRNYDPRRKRDNVRTHTGHPRFTFVRTDLLQDALESLTEGVDVVFHLAGQPGVRQSWAEHFAEHDGNNIATTQRLLEAAAAAGVPRFVHASSSSVYGDCPDVPADEQRMPVPRSPYGVTKLAAEHLCRVYAENYGITTVSLRYFTVYGPRQRPDMAMYRMVGCALTDTPFRLYGSGDQKRDFTYVTDVVAATAAAGSCDVPAGSVLNVAGGAPVRLNDVIGLVGEVTGRALRIERCTPQRGDVARTHGETRLARALLDWKPQVGLVEGLRAQIDWQSAKRPDLAAP
ncbi:NAD-dependent epimerase/dehydratase family protein [Streptomyces sp. NPDC060053]|uniref:NAD-dependent epimerase/dehydratase family protein n=1 Tax=Streptomyces sp. NPDC060053 TaxID=3347047 RepID=UPI0036C820D5